MIRKFQEIIRNGHGLAQLGEPKPVPLHPSWLLTAFPCWARAPMGLSCSLPPFTASTYLSNPEFAQTPRTVDGIRNGVSGGLC